MGSHPAASPIKETKAQKVERLKRAMNPWEGLSEIRRFAREGFASIPPEWIGTYFRWWGVYTQGDGVGVVGGKDGQGLALPFFMLRIRIPNGLLRSDLRPRHRRSHGAAKHSAALGHH
jgi:sulfite reductase (ferredoxin)